MKSQFFIEPLVQEGEDQGPCKASRLHLLDESGVYGRLGFLRVAPVVEALGLEVGEAATARNPGLPDEHRLVPVMPLQVLKVAEIVGGAEGPHGLAVGGVQVHEVGVVRVGVVVGEGGEGASRDGLNLGHVQAHLVVVVLLDHLFRDLFPPCPPQGRLLFPGAFRGVVEGI
jgi:hypothetical protein